MHNKREALAAGVMLAAVVVLGVSAIVLGAGDIAPGIELASIKSSGSSVNIGSIIKFLGSGGFGAVLGLLSTVMYLFPKIKRIADLYATANQIAARNFRELKNTLQPDVLDKVREIARAYDNATEATADLIERDLKSKKIAKRFRDLIRAESYR